MSAPRAIIQMVITGTRILGRAFADAYKQAAANSAAARAAAGGSGGPDASALASGDELTKRSGITLEESTKILNIDDIHNAEEFAKKYEHLYKANDPAEGGSHYLVSKVVRARERIEMELAQIKMIAKQAAEEEKAAAFGRSEAGGGDGPKDKTGGNSGSAPNP
ncbi:mitochondrial import inner membrane translocase subunit TIM16 [Mycoemilia scoparia]|uniref:Mitochondrial import inner membrane translocase subunit TIM16 n=1 Tax=Mycoemilia scoparia TaxID=417184 RepID=A0A9W8A285_9FUNG|nr:mitochondrial import inner membrane translocase subunit TIM16 [Mycoemilia scoparia]